MDIINVCGRNENRARIKIPQNNGKIKSSIAETVFLPVRRDGQRS
jgi:hypothetical protein